MLTAVSCPLLAIIVFELRYFICIFYFVKKAIVLCIISWPLTSNNWPSANLRAFSNRPSLSFPPLVASGISRLPQYRCWRVLARITRGSYFGVPIRPHLVPNWPQIDLKSATGTQNGLTRLGKKQPTFNFQSTSDVMLLFSMIKSIPEVAQICFMWSLFSIPFSKLLCWLLIISETMSHVESLIN